MKSVCVLVFTALLAGVVMVAPANAIPTLYFNEASYLTDLGLLNVGTILEGFEGSDWNGVRYPAAEPIVTSQGLSWLGLTDSVTTGGGWARTGSYGVFETYGDPDGLGVIYGGKTMLGFGGWLATSDATEISYYLNGSFAGTLNQAGYSSHSFFGVIDTDGFETVRMMAPAGHFGADDFTVGVVPEPITLLLLGSGLLGLGIFRRKQ
jgi:hypothetical protein